MEILRQRNAWLNADILPPSWSSCIPANSRVSVSTLLAQNVSSHSTRPMCVAVNSPTSPGHGDKYMNCRRHTVEQEVLLVKMKKKRLSHKLQGTSWILATVYHSGRTRIRPHQFIFQQIMYWKLWTAKVLFSSILLPLTLGKWKGIVVGQTSFHMNEIPDVVQGVVTPYRSSEWIPGTRPSH